MSDGQPTPEGGAQTPSSEGGTAAPSTEGGASSDAPASHGGGTVSPALKARKSIHCDHEKLKMEAGAGANVVCPHCAQIVQIFEVK